MLRLTALALALFLGACSSPGSKRCKEMCEFEARCHADRLSKGEDNMKYDQDECVAACVKLEQDKAGKATVDEHHQCYLEAAGSCDKALETCSGRGRESAKRDAALRP